MQVKSVTNATYIIYLFLHFFVELCHTDLYDDVHNIVRHICLSALHVDIVDEGGGGLHCHAPFLAYGPGRSLSSPAKLWLLSNCI